MFCSLMSIAPQPPQFLQPSHLYARSVLLELKVAISSKCPQSAESFLHRDSSGFSPSFCIDELFASLITPSPRHRAVGDLSFSFVV